MKKRVLIVYPNMGLGGSTTSLLSLLYALDRNKYDIDLQLLENDGELQGDIPDDIHILPQARKTQATSVKRFLSARYIFLMTRMVYNLRVKKNDVVAAQLRSIAGFPNDARPGKEYDIAISFLETWSMYYTARSVNARHKITWLHLNYRGSGIRYSLDRPYLKTYEKIVLVAEEVRRDFCDMAPELADKAVYIPNLLSEEKVRAGAKEDVKLPFEEAGTLKLVTVCRMVPVKAIERAVHALGRLRREGSGENVRWVIVGDGESRPSVEEAIQKEGLEKQVFLVGSTRHPLPYVRKCDAFLLPSYSEGMPMSVTEAQMLGRPCIVTDYPAARTQVKDKQDGLVWENTDEGVYRGFAALVSRPEILKDMQNTMRGMSYGNPQDIRLVEDMLDGMK